MQGAHFPLGPHIGGWPTDTKFLSSEWPLSPRIHNIDQQCYEFWVRVVIPSSFRWARNDEISSFEVPNLVYTYLPNSTFTKKSIEAQLGIYCNDTYLHINGTIYINIWALWYMFCRLKTDTKRTSALASCLDLNRNMWFHGLYKLYKYVHLRILKYTYISIACMKLQVYKRGNLIENFFITVKCWLLYVSMLNLLQVISAKIFPFDPC